MDWSRRSLLKQSLAGLTFPLLGSANTLQGTLIRIPGSVPSATELVEVSIPCARGTHNNPEGLALFSRPGAALPSQFDPSPRSPAGRMPSPPHLFESPPRPNESPRLPEPPPTLP